jgi:endoglucanase
MLDYLDEQIATMDTREKLDAVMDQPFEIAAKWAKANGIDTKNIFLGEFGMIREEYGNPYVIPGATRAAYVKDMIERAERHGFAWSVWSYGGAFGIVEQFDNKPAEPEVMETIRTLD